MLNVLTANILLIMSLTKGDRFMSFTVYWQKFDTYAVVYRPTPNEEEAIVTVVTTDIINVVCFLFKDCDP